MATTTCCAPGAQVQFTGKFLQSTGQQTGREGSCTWTVLACGCGLCAGGHHVAVDEPHVSQRDPRGYEDVAPHERPKWRHIATSNLRTIGTPPRARDYP